MLKYEGNQQVFCIPQQVVATVKGRTEFFNGKQPRYYVVAKDFEDWINEDGLTSELPEPEQEEPKSPSVKGKKVRGKAKVR
jgi:hypothetical protein